MASILSCKPKSATSLSLSISTTDESSRLNSTPSGTYSSSGVVAKPFSSLLNLAGILWTVVRLFIGQTGNGFSVAFEITAGSTELARLRGVGELVGEPMGDRNMQMLLGATEDVMSARDVRLAAIALLLIKKHRRGLGTTVLDSNVKSL